MSFGSSGVQPDEECQTAFEEMKIRHAYSYLIFKIDNYSKIVIDKKSPAVPHDKGAVTNRDLNPHYESFINDLPVDEGRYGVVEVRYNVPEKSAQNKLIFILWAPSNSKVKERMIIASSKDALKKRLNGVFDEVQATELAELELDTIIGRLLAKTGSKGN